MDRPVFLVGAERSGTTLLRLMLSHHPKIAFDNEAEYLVHLVKPDGTLPSREAFVDYLSNARGFLLKKREIRDGLDFVGLANDLTEQTAKGRDVAVYGATVHRHFDRLLWIWPDARFIHLVRDGRDVGLSTIPMGWAGNLYCGMDRWIEAEQIWSGIADKISADRHMTLTYEALIEDPERELTAICRFLGLDYDAAMLDYDRTSTYSKPSANSIGKWQSLDPAAVAAAESRAAPWLIQNGYTLSAPVRAPGKVKRTYYQLHNRWARMRFSQKRLTMRLWLERLVANRLGGKAWRVSVLRREDEIINRHIK